MRNWINAKARKDFQCNTCTQTIHRGEHYQFKYSNHKIKKHIRCQGRP